MYKVANVRATEIYGALTEDKDAVYPKTVRGYVQGLQGPAQPPKKRRTQKGGGPHFEKLLQRILVHYLHTYMKLYVFTWVPRR